MNPNQNDNENSPLQEPLNSDDEFNLEIFRVLEDDNIPAISRIMESHDLTELSLNYPLSDQDVIIQGKPSALCVAAFDGSLESFRYLLINGSSV